MVNTKDGDNKVTARIKYGLDQICMYLYISYLKFEIHSTVSTQGKTFE
jgi:hypothetical protein